MINNLLTVAGQVGTLFLLIAVGFLCAKINMLNRNTIKCLTDFVLYIVTPAAILQAFTSETCSKEKTVNLLYVILFCAIIHFLLIFIAKFAVKQKNFSQNRVLRYAIIFSNCGYMSFPLQKAILGEIGVFYGSMFVAVFNIFVWSYGVLLCSKEKSALSFKKILLNPVIICVAVSLILYFANIKLPSVIGNAVTHLGNLNTPLPMVIIGYHLYHAGILKAFTDKKIYFPAFLRLVVSPALMLGIMVLCGVKGVPLIACTVAASAPTAANTTMFADKFDLDAALSVKMVTLTTLLSIITMPIFVVLAQSV